MAVENSRKSGKNLSLEELLRGMNIPIDPEFRGVEISGLSDDSRSIKTGDLFLAVPGSAYDGRKFISEAASLGAAAVLTSSESKIHTGIPVLYSDNLRHDLAEVAARFFEYPSRYLTVAGITGTNGKTTTIYLLSGIFESAGEKWGRIGTIGCDIDGKHISTNNTTPGVVFVQRMLSQMRDGNLKGCAMEVSSHALDQGRVSGVEFSSATFTNLTQDHLDYHKDLDSYFEAKAMLFKDVPLSIINIDDEYGGRLVKIASGKLVTFGTSDAADLRYECKSMNISGSILEFQYKKEIARIDFSLPGIFNHQNAAAAVATAIGLEMPLSEAVNGLKNAQAAPGRLEAINMGQPFAVFIDYAHTPDALEKLLKSLREFKPRNLHVVFGCGGDRDRKKRPIMGKISSQLADYVFLTSDNPRTEDPEAIINDVLKGVTDKKRCVVIADRTVAIKKAISQCVKGDILVIAGKGHEEYQVVGSVKKFFSDIEVAKSELAKIGYGDHNE